MPLVAHNNLPSFDRLRAEGRTVLAPDRANSQEIREMHIGLLNMMPDKALEATERQFLRLIGESNQIAQFYVHPFTLPALERGDEAKDYIAKHYDTFEDLKAQGLDALIITGANVAGADITQEAFWEPLQEVFAWAWDNVASTICSCLATHAVMQFKYNEAREARGDKLWGVYRHHVTDRDHPLVRGMNTSFDAPHSRFNRISTEQFARAGMKVLAESEVAGVHMAVSPDGFRLLCFQGHPEYDTVSLHKEYTRELARFEAGEIDKPPYPEAYYSDDLIARLNAGGDDSDFDNLLENTWRDSARTVVGNWVGQVYQTTNVNRTKQFMDGVDPNDPLNLRASR